MEFRQEFEENLFGVCFDLQIERREFGFGFQTYERDRYNESLFPFDELKIRLFLPFWQSLEISSLRTFRDHDHSFLSTFGKGGNT